MFNSLSKKNGNKFLKLKILYIQVYKFNLQIYFSIFFVEFSTVL